MKERECVLCGLRTFQARKDCPRKKCPGHLRIAFRRITLVAVSSHNTETYEWHDVWQWRYGNGKLHILYAIDQKWHMYDVPSIYFGFYERTNSVASKNILANTGHTLSRRERLQRQREIQAVS